MLVPSMGSVRDPPVIQERDWTYRVVETTREAVHISAEEHGTAGLLGIWHFTFAPNGRILSVASPRGLEPFVSVEDAPILGQEGVDAWPRFPLYEDFPLDDGDWHAVHQQSHPAGGELEVAIVRTRRKPRQVGAIARTATQRWEAGRPWWSTLRIEEKYTGLYRSVTYLKIEGEVIAWPASTP
jgi:hypothetical protein